MTRGNWHLNLTLATVIPLAVIVLSFLGGAPLHTLLSLIVVWSIFAIGFDLIFGLTGIISFGHAAFFGIGAYAYAVLTLSWGVSEGVALLAAILFGTVLGALFGIVSLRISGIYFGLTTLIMAEMVNHLIAIKLKRWTGGTDGLAGVSRPEILGLNVYDDHIYLILLVLVFWLVLLGAAVLRASAYGQVLSAIRQNPVRAEQLGYDVSMYKCSAFAISGGVSGLAGALLGGLIYYVGPQMTHWATSGDVLIMTVLGGRGTFAGPVVGVALFEFLREGVGDISDHWHGLLGLIFIAVTLWMPGGVVGLIQERVRRRRALRAELRRATIRTEGAT
jgi:branched-chain amino acid transport system permease protein